MSRGGGSGMSHKAWGVGDGGVNLDRGDANEERKGAGEMGRRDGKLISGLKRDAPVMLH